MNTDLNASCDYTSKSTAATCGCAAPEETVMTVSALRAALTAAPDLPLTVLWPDGDAIEAHFHVTEVGRVQKDFVDCGGTVRRTITCLLQTWLATMWTIGSLPENC